ncbi:MAG: alpha/beta hydrolase [Anaerolineaceae bacterium]|nr:alpha/beta hydrolase [Anaerolineaceae bacterium]
MTGSILAQEGTEMNAQNKPTIVLVHGAFADSSSWEGVTRMLLAEGYPVVAAANPLRGLQNDADYVANVINSIEGPVVLVGHSYGGMVISNAVQDNSNVQALVYIDAFAPEAGESAFALSTLYPGSTLGTALAPVALPDGTTDLYIQPEKFHAQFAADVPETETQWMAATQRPVTDFALNEASGDPAWKTIPSWFIYGDADLNIPPALMAYMAERADAWETVVIEGGSHVVMISHPDEVTHLIKRAANEVEIHFEAAG